VSDTPHQKSALITGASSGIGAAFARRLAQQGYRLILVARRRERLEQLRDELAAESSARAEVCVADLADAANVERVAELTADQPDLELLVNNAGFGTMGRYVDTDVQRQLDMIRVHVLATVRLTRAAVPGMMERDCGGIINVSSIGAWLSVSGSIQYASTKIYLNSFSEGLQDELRHTKIRVQALCPGFTYTEFHDAEHMEGFQRSMIPKRMWMSADDVVDYSLKMLPRRRVIVIPGWRNRVLGRIFRSPWLKPFIRRGARYKVEEA
jgi:short-subunit dehydrogenase